jgi:hypothetical protein
MRNDTRRLPPVVDEVVQWLTSRGLPPSPR